MTTTVLHQTLSIATRTSYNLPGKVLGLLPVKVVEDRLLLYFITEIENPELAQESEITTALDIVIVGTGEPLPEDFPKGYVYLGTEVLWTGYTAHCYARLYVQEEVVSEEVTADADNKDIGTEV